MIPITGADDANNTSSGTVVVGDSSCPDGTEVSEEEDARRNEAYLAFFRNGDTTIKYAEVGVVAAVKYGGIIVVLLWMNYTMARERQQQ